MAEPGIPFVYNGHAYRLRALKLDVEPGGLPRWIVDVDGAQGQAHSLENAVLYAARGADGQRLSEAG